MNSKVLIVDFAVFSCVLNAVIAWYLFDFDADEIIPVLTVFINTFMSLLVIVLITSILASLSAGQMLKQGKMKAIDITSAINKRYMGSCISRLIILAGLSLLIFAGLLFVVLRFYFDIEMTASEAGIVSIVFCSLIGLLFTPLVAINRVSIGGA